LEHAEEWLRSSLSIARRLAEQGQGPGVATPLGNLADVRLDRGDLAEARQLTAEHLAAALAEENDLALADAHMRVAWLEALDGRFDEAAGFLRHPLSLARVIGSQYEGGALLLAALIAARRHDSLTAARLIGAVDASRARGDLGAWALRTIPGRTIAELREELDESGYAEQLRRGAELSADGALELALSTVD
jgi:hypothetical protein